MRTKLLALTLAVAATLTLGVSGVVATDYVSTDDAQITTELPEYAAGSTDETTDKEYDRKISADELTKIDGDDTNWTVETIDKEYDRKISADELTKIDGDDTNWTVEINDEAAD